MYRINRNFSHPVFWAGVVSLFLTLGIAQSGFCQAFFVLNADMPGGGQAISQSSSGPISATFANNKVDYDLTAERGFLKVLNHHHYSGTGVDASALMRFDDVVFSGPQGAVSVTTSVNILLEGGTSFSSNDPFTQFQTISVRLELPNNGTGGRMLSTYQAMSSQSGFMADGIFAGMVPTNGIDSAFTGPSFTVPVGVPVTLGFKLEIYVSSAAQLPYTIADFGSGSSSKLNGDRGMVFPTGEPVFNLPAEYSVNSTQAQICENMWNDPRNPVAVENSTWGNVKSLFR